MNCGIHQYNESLKHLGDGDHLRDLPRAFALNEIAATLGQEDAILAMGWFYLNGFGVERSNTLARTWYRRSARRGEPRAMFSLGWISYDEHAYSEARRWFERATKHGHIRSYYWLGKLAWRGLGVCRDRSAAFALFHRAAQKNDNEAIRTLRFLSRTGRKLR